MIVFASQYIRLSVKTVRNFLTYPALLINKQTNIQTNNLKWKQKFINKDFHSHLGNKLSRNTPHMIKSKHYTVAADTLTDNDVYGYAGSIGPFLQKRAFVPQTVGKRASM